MFRTLFRNTRKMTCTSFLTLSGTIPATQLLIFQAGSWDYPELMNRDHAQLQLSPHCLQFSRSNIGKYCLHKYTTHVYCIPPKKQTRLYRNTKPIKDYHELLPKNMHRNNCFYTHKSLYSSHRQYSYKTNNKNITLSYLELCTTSITKAIHNILEAKHYKHPSSKVMLHPAPQIKLWGGVGLEGLKGKHLL